VQIELGHGLTAGEHLVKNAQGTQHPGGVWPEAHARSDLPERRLPLVYDNVKSCLAKRERRGKPANSPSSDDQFPGHWLLEAKCAFNGMVSVRQDDGEDCSEGNASRARANPSSEIIGM
jgi:hypothetical protein